ncbi:hypothetical protein NT6N_02960 [Oceaniferula spumae]|uniref:PD-(D/E)XK endonuclease-like domain-containing protein n=1 Tax=Oceaniferula spumae TaxID=2979115 RepID=A0AAT9FH01_9BACT
MISTLNPTTDTSARGNYGRALDYISASRLSCWQQCRRKHYFRYVANIPSEPSPAMHLGKVVHATLQQWNLWRWDRKPYTMNDLHAAFFHSWEKEQVENTVPWKSDKEHDDLRDKAWELVTAYLDAAVIEEDEDIAGVEVRLEAEIEGLPTVIGIVDLVRGGGRIVDFKTAAKSPSQNSAGHVHGTQLGIYALLYRHCTGTRELGIELHHLVKTKVPKVCVSEFGSMSDREIGNVIALMHQYVDSVKAGDCTPSPSFMCSGCEYLSQCKNWQGGAEHGNGDAS